MKLSVALSLGVAVLPEIASAAGGFYQSCKNTWYMDGSHMIAECKRWNGQYMRTRQDMNLCITNEYGKLKAGNGGQFYRSCWGCQQGRDLITDPEPPTSYLTCICQTGDGDEESTSLDLNPFVENLDGYLWCFGHRSEAF